MIDNKVNDKWVRFWQTRHDGAGRYATCGWLRSNDGTTSTIDVPRSGRNTTGRMLYAEVQVPTKDVEVL